MAGRSFSKKAASPRKGRGPDQAAQAELVGALLQFFTRTVNRVQFIQRMAKDAHDKSSGLAQALSAQIVLDLEQIRIDAAAVDRSTRGHRAAHSKKQSGRGTVGAEIRKAGEKHKVKAVAQALHDAKYSIPASGHWRGRVLVILRDAGISDTTTSWLRDHRAALVDAAAALRNAATGDP